MPPSWRLARNWLAGKPWRLAMMIGAVTLACALVVAVSCAVASVRQSLDKGLTSFLGAADARIIHPFNGRFGVDLLETVRAWPEVALATGRLGSSLTLVHADQRRNAEGELLRSTPNALGVEFENEVEFRPMELVEGQSPREANDILLDPIAAEELKAKAGDALEVQRFGEPIALRVAGVLQRPRLPAVQRPFIELDRHVLEEAAGHTNELTSILIIVKDGVDVMRFCEAHKGDVPETLSLEPSDRIRAGFDRQADASRLGFIVASMLTFMSASFIIVTAMTTSVAQRQREMAVTRCVGASRGQLFASQILAGLIISIVGAILGIPLGIGLTGLLYWYYSDMLPGGLAIAPLGLELALLGAIAAGVIGALYPAWLASHVSPLQAMGVQARPPRRRSLFIALGLALALITLQLLLFQIPDPSQRFFWYAYVGLPSLQAGYFIVAVPVMFIAAILIAPLLEAIMRLPAGMLRQSVLATLFRHGFTAGALMVGIAILVSSWSNAQSLLNDWLGKIKFADAFAYRAMGITPQQQKIINELPFVEQTCPLAYLPVRVFDRQIFGIRGIAPPNVTLFGFDPDRFLAMNSLDWYAGSPESALPRLRDGSGVIVADRFLTTQQVQLGDKLKLGSSRVQKEYEIVGSVSSAGLDIVTQLFGIRSQYTEMSISAVFIAFSEVERTFDNHDALMMQVNLKPDVDDEQATKAVEKAVPGVSFRSGRAIMKEINEIAVGAMAVNTTVAFAALILASLGVGNIILANIHGRRYEYGVLRAVGGQRGLLVRLILGEAVLIAIAGATVGTSLGLHLAAIGAANYRDLAGLPVRVVVPWLPTLSGWLALLALTVLASWPGIRAAIKPNPSALLAGGRHG